MITSSAFTNNKLFHNVLAFNYTDVMFGEPQRAKFVGENGNNDDGLGLRVMGETIH